METNGKNQGLTKENMNKGQMNNKKERRSSKGYTSKDVATKIVENPECAMLTEEVMKALDIRTRPTLPSWEELPYIVKTFSDAKPRRVYVKEIVIEYLADITEKRLQEIDQMKKERSSFLAA